MSTLSREFINNYCYNLIMAINSPKTILKKQNVKPIKYLGQNFLIDKKILSEAIKAANFKPSDIIIEIGPGTGILTQELAKRAEKVIAIEKDPKMCDVLRELLKCQKIGNVEVIEGDALKIENSKLFKNLKLKIKNYKVVANLPYYITSPVIRKFLESKNPPRLMVLMVQKEVAQRICEKPPRMNLLAVSVQFYAKPEIISYVPKESFWPKPKVDSAIIKIIPHHFRDPVSHRFREQFFRIVKAGFSQPRKQLANNLSKGLELNKEQIKRWLVSNKIKPTQRAETLNINDWINLTKTIIL